MNWLRKIPGWEYRVSTYLTARNIKIALTVFGLFLIFFLLVYIQLLVKELQQREQNLIDLYASAFQFYTTPAPQPGNDIRFFLEKIVPSIDFPVVITDENDEPYQPYSEFTLNIDLQKFASEEQQREYLKSLIADMQKVYSPIVLKYPDYGILMKIYYSESDILRQLKVLPFVAFIGIALFILIGYWGFDYIRRNEQNKVWIGLAKEAAHQLGTPVSSLLAWIELMKMNLQDQKRLMHIASEMENDLRRIEKVLQRFSQIGSIPERTEEDLAPVIHEVVDYFRRRIPNIGKRIEIIENLESIRRPINRDLFQWVIENLIKNAVEAIVQEDGTIELHLYRKNGKAVILVKDTGKGMSASVRRTAFRPGFTTKARGWGLGLTLCKRIIEDYHGGKILIHSSTVGKGTTFLIEV